MNDSYIRKKLQAKDRTAFEWVFTYYYAGLCAFAYQLVSDRVVAEDLVQDFFVRLWKKCDSYEIRGSVKSFLFQSVRNSCLDHLKHRKVVSSFEQDYRYAAEESIDSISFAREELEALVRRALDQLPPRCREIFVLSRFEDLSNQEIADRLGISKRTVEVQISKALKLLKELL